MYIANMSPSRDKGRGLRTSVFEIESVPSEKVTQRIVEHEAIEKYVIKL